MSNLQIDVTYEGGEPREVEYYHINHGLMRFDMAGKTAEIDGEYNRLSSERLAEGYKHCRPTTGDVIRSVQELPFVEKVDARRLTLD